MDEEGFNKRMAEQRERARAARKNAGNGRLEGERQRFQQLMANTFVGYQTMEADAVIQAIIRDDELIDSLSEGEEAYIVMDTTPFYAESGGQVGDVGHIRCNGAVFEVTNTVKSPAGVSICVGRQEQGELSVGAAVRAEVDCPIRLATMRNHTAAHLLQAALRQVLGHPCRAGRSAGRQPPCPFRLFTHFSALTANELQEVEDLVNAWILAGIQADIREMPIDEARRLGAMALFGEK